MHSRRRRPLRRRETSPPKKVLPIASAEAAGLTYVTDADPGIRRRRSGRGFSYAAAAGGLVRDQATLRRIRALAIPPAWTDVWVCVDPDGHIQATGRDAKGRKQYRYHQQWREARDETKFERMFSFGSALPRMRARVDADLRKRGLPREKVLATVVRLLEATLIRVGNEEYARANQSYGLTTLRKDQHVDISGARLRFTFRGKSGKDHVIEVRDRRLAALVKQVEELPGQDLIQYVDDTGAIKGLGSHDVNAYLREISGDDFTAKDFRTWFGTVLAARALLDIAAEKPTKKAINDAVRGVSQKLGNTLAVCRRSYVHPGIFAARGDGTLAAVFAEEHVDVDGLPGDERRVLALLARLKNEPPPSMLSLLERSVEKVAGRSAGAAASVKAAA